MRSPSGGRDRMNPLGGNPTRRCASARHTIDMSRLDWWREQEWRVLPTYGHVSDEDPLQQAFQERLTNPTRPQSKNARGFTQTALHRSAKEIVYHREGGKPALTFVTWSLDLGTCELVLYPSWSTVDLEHEDLKEMLAYAMLFHVPVVPDDETLRPELEAAERELIAEGFVKTDKEGDEKRYRYRPLESVDLDTEQVFTEVERRLLPSSTEVRLALSAARRELDARARAGPSP
jgi:hypothetical protein